MKKLKVTVIMEVTMDAAFDMADTFAHIKEVVERAQEIGSAYAEVEVPAGKVEVR